MDRFLRKVEPGWFKEMNGLIRSLRVKTSSSFIFPANFPPSHDQGAMDLVGLSYLRDG